MCIVSKIKKEDNHVGLTHQDRYPRRHHLHLPFLRPRRHPVQHSSVDR